MPSKTLELKIKIISINVGFPREVPSKRKTVATGIFKEPASERVMVRSLNLDTDRQADLTVDGGLDKAVYVYPFEHYDYFGKSFTLAGFREENVNLGDRFRIGDVHQMVTQPRLLCYQLGIRFGKPDMAKQFLESR